MENSFYPQEFWDNGHLSFDDKWVFCKGELEDE